MSLSITYFNADHIHVGSGDHSFKIIRTGPGNVRVIPMLWPTAKLADDQEKAYNFAKLLVAAYYLQGQMARGDSDERVREMASGRRNLEVETAVHDNLKLSGGHGISESPN